MIRFINIKDQIIEGESAFAWYDTIRDCFLEFGGTQVWSSWLEFVDDLAEDTYWKQQIERFRNLFPNEKGK